MSGKWMSEGAACKALGLKEWELVGLLDTEKLEYKEGERGEIWVSVAGVQALGRLGVRRGRDWSDGVTSKTGFPLTECGKDDLSTRDRKQTAEYDYEYERDSSDGDDTLDADRLICEKEAAGIVGVCAQR